MKKKRFGVNVGSSSILVIFVILCLVSFAALSSVSANSDYRLSKKMADRELAYYNACNEAYEALSSIDIALYNAYLSAPDADSYFAQVGTGKSYTYPVSDIQSLQVTINILYPGTPSSPCYEIAEWRVVTTGTLEYQDSLPVMQ